jgi:peptidoglycan/LPS O-acetylase OafA/YrhL
VRPFRFRATLSEHPYDSRGVPGPGGPISPDDHSGRELAHPRYRPDIDGLRAVAVLSVVGYHVSPTHVKGGFIGVDIFFVISGFLISSIILGNHENASFSVAEFYRRRVRRILPALIVVLAAVLALGWFVLPWDEYRALGIHVLGGVGFVSNLVLWGEAGYFDLAASTKPLLHLWSLAVEEQFYILWPAVLGVAWKRRWNFLAVIAAIALVSFAVSVASLSDHVEAAFYSPLARFWELMIGGLLAHAALYRPALLARLPQLQSTLGLALLAAGLAFIDRSRAFPGWWALLPTLGTALLIAAGPGGWVNRALLSNRAAVWLGKISYPLYLWHWPALSFALILDHYVEPGRLVRYGAVLLAIVLAHATYVFVEKPVRLRHGLSVRQILGLFGLVGAVAAIVVLLDGVPRRAFGQTPARQFVDRYNKLHRFGLIDAYQARCDFYRWNHGVDSSIRDRIDSTCTPAAGERPIFLLWGDSHAQALSYGMRRNLPRGVAFAQVTTSGCRPSLHDELQDEANQALCRAGNTFAREYIAKQKPARVFVAQVGRHLETDWLEMARFVEANHGELILVGPVPQWRPSLPLVVAEDFDHPREFVSRGLDREVLAMDRQLREKYAGTLVHYVSPVEALCRADGCRARVPTTDPYDLLALDYGHLTPAGSDFVARVVLGDLLHPAK